MARQELVKSVTLVAGADLTAAQFTFVDIASGAVTRVGAVTDRAIGVLQNTPNTGEAAEVALLQGIVKVRAGEAIAQDGVVKADATGRATDVAIATSEIEIGIALTAAGAADELVEVLCGGVRGGIA